MEPLTKEQLAAICARANAATPGPWVWHEGDLLTEDNFSRQHSSMFSSVLHLTDDAQGVNDLVSWEYVRSVEDAEFIAYARTDIPALLAEIDRFKRAIRELDVLLRDFVLVAGEEAALKVESMLD